MLDSNIRFLIFGAAKSATTWLQRSLERSPTISMPSPELHYFSDEYHRGPDWYLSQFNFDKPDALVGEKSNTYLTVPQAAERIRKDLPDVRLIVQMREPAARAYSDYCMLFRRGEVSRNIEDHLDPARAADKRFINNGRYAMHLRRFYDLFPPEQILLLLFEDIRREPEAQLARLASHIGHDAPLAAPVDSKVKDKNAAVVPLSLRRVLKPFRPVLDGVRHTKPIKVLRDAVARPQEYPPLSPDLEKRLQDFYAPEVSELEQRIGRPLDVWRDMRGA
ncbi:putative sulfotransferase protein [Stappia aggregata IAM 12614]|uniref:Putative sulfotransferase protein n=1 Tax=Roseibium aggregatum (strain ATCC 25650 / DSM 13394 / JCM 20685 / NBRC 16684 / NCIMB 2208 / IAM 12614 / B1) TaxID=384765 RepID=A0NNT6_ROSAI|nr:sulfotransferase [Roseibium aggregatum]EAV45817.1 putative sulfotransferase protein [Stappia aggregata IAM 12614] [Roseibium aggregatum IAM 12614]